MVAKRYFQYILYTLVVYKQLKKPRNDAESMRGAGDQTIIAIFIVIILVIFLLLALLVYLSRVFI